MPFALETGNTFGGRLQPKHGANGHFQVLMKVMQLFTCLFFVGQAVSSGLSTEFEMVHLKKCPPQYSNLSELMTVFKRKIGLSSVMSGETRVSARFTYVMSNWGAEGRWPSNSPDHDALANHYGSLLCGSYDDPVNELQLAATWPSVIGDMMVDNKHHTYFTPLSAPCWSIRLCYTDDIMYVLSSYLFEFLKITDRRESMSDLLNILHDESDRDMSQALSKITDPQAGVLPIMPVKLTSGITKVVTDPQALLRKGAYTLGRIAAVRERIPKDILFDLKSFLFYESTNSAADEATTRRLSSSMYTFCHKLKAAPIDSLTHKTALCVVVVNMCHGGLSAVAQLWHMLVSELRTHLDSGTLLPGIEGATPDLKTCLLHQKLQMLNCCIQCKQQREQTSSGSCASFKTACNQLSTDALQIVKKSPEISIPGEEVGMTGDVTSADITTGTTERIGSFQSDSDEEFYECESELADNCKQTLADDLAASGERLKLEERQKTSSSLEVKKSETTDNLRHAEGRSCVCDGMRLLHFDRPLYIPATQEHAPVTEDLLEEQADVFSKLGDTKEGSRVRAKMQSASLLSDMKAFKAANPGCCLEDFLRWYSPKDFEDGKLSQRMLIPNNLWVASWGSAKPVPVTRQKRIFDDTKEAEKVLHFLANLKPGEVAQLVLPLCVHEALVVIRLAAESMADCLPSLPLICDQIESKASQSFRSWRMHGTVSNQFVPWNAKTRAAVNDIFTQITFAESLIERARSLRHKFVGLGSESLVNAFVRKLLEHPEVPLDGAAEGREGGVVRKYFEREQRLLYASKESDSKFPELTSEAPVPKFPDPTGREFIIRATHAYPSSGSRDLPHRFYAVLMRNEYRLASAISADTTFF